MGSHQGASNPDSRAKPTGKRDFVIAVLPGDGIGPEVTGPAREVLEAAAGLFGVSVRVRTAPIGGCALEEQGHPLPAETVRVCTSSDAVLLGAVGGPRWDRLENPAQRPESALLTLRAMLGNFANLRPARVFGPLVGVSPLKPELASRVDLMVVRELTGGLYFSQPKQRLREAGGCRAVDTLAYSEREVERVVRWAFQVARSRRGRLASVDKANVLESSRLWREVASRVADDYPDVICEHLYVDNCAAQLIRDPGRFDVIVTENTFGDILSDEAAGLVGTLGLAPSASLGGQVPLFEPVHGSAPDIAGKGVANPLAAILSVAMLFEYGLGMAEPARAIERAVVLALEAGLRTADIYTPGCANTTRVDTRAMTGAVLSRLTAPIPGTPVTV